MPTLQHRSTRRLLAAGVVLLAAVAAPAGAADQAACITAGLEPASLRAGTAAARLELRSCLARSTPAPGLCAGVPPVEGNDVMSIEAWYIKGCPGKALVSDHCHQLMDEVAAYCRTGAPGN